MNKENEFCDNELSTGIQDSLDKSTYSSRFYKTQNRIPKKLLPSKYQKAAITIQRYWRLRLALKRTLCHQVANQIQAINQCYELQNRVLQKLVDQYSSIVAFKQTLMKMSIQDSLSDFQTAISSAKKQCVVTSFKLEKKNPKKDLLAQLIHKKQEERELNLMLNREKLIVEEDLEEQKKQQDLLLQEYKRLNQQHLQLVQEKHDLSHKNAQKLLETSKFGSRHQSTRTSSQGKTFIIDFFQNTDLTQ